MDIEKIIEQLDTLCEGSVDNAKKSEAMNDFVFEAAREMAKSETGMDFEDIDDLSVSDKLKFQIAENDHLDTIMYGWEIHCEEKYGLAA